MTFSRADMLAAATSRPLRQARAIGMPGSACSHPAGGWRIQSAPSPIVGGRRSGSSTTRSSARGTSSTIPKSTSWSDQRSFATGSLRRAMASGLTLRIPAYLRYDLQDDNGDLKIAALYAFWELPAMVGQFLRSGPRRLPAVCDCRRSCWPTRALTGTLGFLSGFRGAGPQGKRRFREFLTDARAGDEVAVRRWLTKKARITTGDDLPLSTSELMSASRAGVPAS